MDAGQVRVDRNACRHIELILVWSVA
jgi:hypothetical protein